ncbi:MAG: S8 family peptidase [Flavobacteriales bacterium]|nr:S8 family peptidase [Flavobacteriales bacterium]
MIRCLLLGCVLSSTAILGQVRMPATTRADLAILKELAVGFPKATELTNETQGYYPTAMVNGRCMVGFLGLADGSSVEGGGERVMFGARKGNIVSFRVDAYHLDELESLTGLSYVELAGKAKPTLDKVIWSIHADSVHAGIGLPQPYTGKDVLIGITDWGFDYTHPMFYDTLLQESRVRGAWDQYRQTGPAPSDFGYGTEMLSPEALAGAQSDTANIYGWATHGSHVAGIAGGSGGGTDYRGVAFEAQYLFCTFLVDAAAVLDAFAWMQQVAEADDKRLVINMSWGLYWIGTLDGASLLSQAIDQFSDEGVVFVNSGGNNGDVAFHIKKDFDNDSIITRVQFYPYAAHPNMWGQSLTMWGEPGGSFSAGFVVANSANTVLQETPWYNTATQATYLDSMLIIGTDTVFFNLTADAAHPQNGRPHFRLRIANRNTQYRINMRATAANGTVHFWNLTELTNDVGNWGQTFSAGPPGFTGGDRYYGIGEPACTESLVTVAAHSSDYLTSGGSAAGGTIANFSSYGPTMDERAKPDITAPGVSVGSSISSFTDNSYTTLTTVDFQGRTYPFARFSGTSMSAPAVTGVVALMLEADPTLTPAEVKEIIKLTARTDVHTGGIPPEGSTRWGMGKVNAYRAILQVMGTVGSEGLGEEDIMLWPNPVTDVVNVMSSFTGPLRILVSDVTGRTMIQEGRNAGSFITLSTVGWPSGMYHIRLIGADGSTVAKFIKR